MKYNKIFSGISAASHKTYITEESSLVIETLENGMNHHYLIPPQVRSLHDTSTGNHYLIPPQVITT